MLPRPLFACVVLLLLGWASVTHARARTWQNNLTLWTDAGEKAPRRPRAFINIGIARELVGDWQGAEQAYLQAIVLSGQPHLTRYQQVFHRAAGEVNLARLYAQTGHPAEGLQMLDGVLQRHPRFTHAHFVKGVVLAWLKRCDDASQSFEAAGPSFPVVACPS